MNVRRIAGCCLVAALLELSVAGRLNAAVALQRGPPLAAQETEVLTRGPVHEAFAEIVSFNPQPGTIVAKAPPQAIEELPPEQRPEGDNVAWIPGYWAWDDERTDFLWVSGTWRALPPGRQWVPGYWGSSGQGAQWTSGYWADAEANDVEYLPEPPATVETGPNVSAPSVDHTWLPGCWLWQQNRYAWRPGYWAAGQSDWDWVPAHYVWTPRGYLFVDGYYDYSVARRGVLFAPVYFNSGIYRQRGFSYSPTVVISPAVFSSHLFLRPGYGHYYYGDYYAASYAAAGYSPWFSFTSSRRGYDPFYAQQRWGHRNERQWDRRVEADFAHRRDDEKARPPRTWADQKARLAIAGTSKQQNFVVAESLEDLAKNKQYPQRFRPLAKTERQQIAQQEQAVRHLRDQRQKSEVSAADPSVSKPDSTPAVRGTKMKLPRSPIVAPDRLGKDHVPPRTHAVPTADPRVEPKPRRTGGQSTTPSGRPNLPQPQTNPVLPKAEPKSERPRGESKPTPKVEPKPTPKAGPKPAPKAEPKPTPKTEPRPDRPKVKPKKQSNRESTETAQGASDVQSKGSAQRGPKGEGKQKSRKRIMLAQTHRKGVAS